MKMLFMHHHKWGSQGKMRTLKSPSDIVTSYMKDFKLEQKSKVAQNCGLFLVQTK